MARRISSQDIDNIKEVASFTGPQDRWEEFERAVAENMSFRQLTFCFQNAYQHCRCPTHRAQSLGQRQASRLRDVLARTANNRSTTFPLQAPAVDEQMDYRAVSGRRRQVQGRQSISPPGRNRNQPSQATGQTTTTIIPGVALGAEALQQLQVELGRLVAIQRQQRDSLIGRGASPEGRRASPQSPSKTKSPLSRSSGRSTSSRSDSPPRSISQGRLASRVWTEAQMDNDLLRLQAASNQAAITHAATEGSESDRTRGDRPLRSNVARSSSEAQLVRSPASGGQSAAGLRQRGSERPTTPREGDTGTMTRTSQRERPGRHGSTQQEAPFEDWITFSY